MYPPSASVPATGYRPTVFRIEGETDIPLVNNTGNYRWVNDPNDTDGDGDKGVADQIKSILNTTVNPPKPKYNVQVAAPFDTNPNPPNNPLALADVLARLGAGLGTDETVTASIDQNAANAFIFPAITKAQITIDGNPLWSIGNPLDPFALWESFYRHPLFNRPATRPVPSPQLQPLVSQSVPDPLITTGISLPPGSPANLAGALHELRFLPQGPSAGPLANYRLSGFKMEQYAPDNPANPTFYRPTWGLTIKVSALIYAQEGSWFVIPGPYFDESASNDDTRPGRGNAVRYRRYNYRVVVNGAIVQNHTADDFPITMGNKNVYTFNAGKWEERIAYPSFDPTLSAYVWNGIEYNWDPELKNARVATEDAITGNNKPVLKLPKLPLGPDLIFVG